MHLLSTCTHYLQSSPYPTVTRLRPALLSKQASRDASDNPWPWGVGYRSKRAARTMALAPPPRRSRRLTPNRQRAEMDGWMDRSPVTAAGDSESDAGPVTLHYMDTHLVWLWSGLVRLAVCPSLPTHSKLLGPVRCYHSLLHSLHRPWRQNSWAAQCTVTPCGALNSCGAQARPERLNHYVH